MDLEHFQKLSGQLASGKVTHLQFLEVLKEFGKAFEPPDEHTRKEKKKMLAMLEDIIDKARHLEQEEKDELAQEAEAWLYPEEDQAR